MERINVLVTSVGGFGLGASVVKALLSSSIPMRIVGTDMSPRLIHASPLLDKEIIPSARSDNFIDELGRVVKKYSIACIFTGAEVEMLKVSQYRAEIEALGVKVFLNTDRVIRLCKNKFECNGMLESLGFSVPRTILINDISDIEKVDFSPVVLKPFFNTGASANVFVAESEDELRFFASYLLSKKIELIVQEYLPYDNNEYTVGIVSLLETSEVISSIALRKFMEGPTVGVRRGSIVISSGNTQGEFLEFVDVRKVCEKIAVAIHSKGPLNVQLRVVNGKVMPFEINPRFSGSTSARAANGWNAPEFYIRRYIMNDINAESSLRMNSKGFAIKCYEEKYIPYEK